MHVLKIANNLQFDAIINYCDSTHKMKRKKQNIVCKQTNWVTKYFFVFTNFISFLLSRIEDRRKRETLNYLHTQSTEWRWKKHLHTHTHTIGMSLLHLPFCARAHKRRYQCLLLFINKNWIYLFHIFHSFIHCLVICAKPKEARRTEPHLVCILLLVHLNFRRSFVSFFMRPFVRWCIMLMQRGL